MSDSWGNRPDRGDYATKFIQGARLIPVKTVTGDYPLLREKIGEWVSHSVRGHIERVLVTDSISYMNGIPHVLVRRDPPKTGGHIPAAQLVTALAIYQPPQSAIVVYNESAL
jgi:hypothetical protein